MVTELNPRQQQIPTHTVLFLQYINCYFLTVVQLMHSGKPYQRVSQHAGTSTCKHVWYCTVSKKRMINLYVHKQGGDLGLIASLAGNLPAGVVLKQWDNSIRCQSANTCIKKQGTCWSKPHTFPPCLWLRSMASGHPSPSANSELPTRAGVQQREGKSTGNVVAATGCIPNASRTLCPVTNSQNLQHH